MNIREFTDEEIAEINNYVTTQIPQTILPQLFILSEEPIKKVKIFLTIYRILSGAKDFAANESTKNKLLKILNEAEDAYNKLYEITIEIDRNTLDLKEMYLERDLIKVLLKNNLLINSFINSFLVFAEKQELIPTDAVSGIDIGAEEGKDLYKKIISKV